MRKHARKVGLWLRALEAHYAGEYVDPMVRKTLEEICASAAEGETPGQIVIKLAVGGAFSVNLDKSTVRAIIKHNNALEGER